MELSLQKNNNPRQMLNTRRMMITKEKLHINKKIDYEGFLQLFRKYGRGIEEKDFAKYVLDIPSMKYYYLKSGKTTYTPILSREYISTKYLETIREQVEAELKENGIKKINYSLIRNLYNTYGGKLDISTFAEEILGISAHSVECLKSESQRSAVLFSRSSPNSVVVRKKQNEIIVAEKLHIDDTITLSRFQELYEKYGKGFSERDFANKILQIPQSRFVRLKSGKNAYTTILESYIFNPEFIFRLREKVIQKEDLHIDDLIDNDRFQELYRKYGLPLSEEMFAEEILDISAVGVKNMRVAGTNAMILGDIEIPEEFVLELRNKVARENGLWRNQLLSPEKLDELYSQYGGILSKRKFVTLILDVDPLNYNSFLSREYSGITILKDYYNTEIMALRRRAISENRLHYDDLIDYKTFHKLHKKYAPEQRESVFAESVLDIPQRIFYNLKSGSTKKVNILRNETLPTDEEFENLKLTIALKHGFHIKDKIDYRTFKRIFNTYSGIVPEYMFAEKIFDISKTSLSKIQNDPEARVLILADTKMPDDKIQKLRNQVRLDNTIYPGKEISYSQFEKMYKSYEHILSERLFAKLILGINFQSFNKVKNGSYDTIEAFGDARTEIKKRSKHFNDDEVKSVREYLIQGLNEEEIATRLFITMPFLKKNMDALFRYDRLSWEEIEAERIKREEENKKLKSTKESKNSQKEEKKARAIREKEGQALRKKKIRIMDDFDISDKDVETLKAYVKNCGERFKYGEFPEIEIPDLEECYSFFEAGLPEIKLFAKICISFGLYKKASVFVSNNMANEGITRSEKQDLNKLQEYLRYSIRKVDAVDMISKGIADTSYIATRTGILEVDVVRMKKRMAQGESPIVNVFPSDTDFDAR